ncbi:N-acetyltransferase family protein [Sunxiuqinia elliptica]|uniref:Acetyltransferase (GNAT) family protein n=1 Tax=Sunxiuqinia elliptica TaxID=655355 RepID=A0A1I2M2W3_9BACT|nr:GNAT family N-acetyltransferase [Sunxiuqinia elliptica]SFF85854.1 Acetyltransferase (GNAT) family protein [Sunxiuqinia elliptica]
MNYTFVPIDLTNETHEKQLLRLLDIYMQDEMGKGAPMNQNMAPKIMKGLRTYSGYLGFFAVADGEYAALANCNHDFSTFQAKPLINIHDFVVHPDFRGKGAGLFLLEGIAAFAREHGYCRINLEVRHDNVGARKLYQKAGYNDCEPRMYLWEKIL